jgi:hypothetical protein
MMKLNGLFTAVAAAAAMGLSACGGGGGSGSDESESASKTTSPAPAPMPAAPAPSPSPPPPAQAPSPVPAPSPDTSPGALGVAPVVRVLRDDRVATIEMDYNAANPTNQFWTMSGSPDDDAGFLVTWWPQATTLAERTAFISSAGGLCLSTDRGIDTTATDAPAKRLAIAGTSTSTATPAATTATPMALDLPVGAKWLVTANRRVQLQPLDNNRPYQVRVQRLSARGKISSQAVEFAFNGGDATRVAALRSSLTHFDDFNLPMGAADETLWNNASTVSTNPLFNLFFVNDQFHAHTLHGTKLENTGDRSQSSQRFRKKVRIESNTRRRIVFDMDSLLSPRSVWYLDFNPIPTEVTGHASFFDEEGALGLPAGILRLRAQGQTLSVSIVDLQGASHQVASVDMEAQGRQAIPNVRRSFDLRVGTNGIEVFIDGKSVINTAYGNYTLPAADYELLWVDFGYNTTKDGVPYFLHHWDNFGFDGPVVDDATVHNYVTRIEGTDYQKANLGSNQRPTFTVNIPDDLRPATAGATAEAWLVFTYQMGDYSYLNIASGDTVRVNGGASYALPQPRNNSLPLNANANSWGTPHTGRVKLGDIVRGGASPLVVGDNSFQFNVTNAGLLNMHVEVAYPRGSAPAYTPPAALHRFPLHTDLPRFGPPIRFTHFGAAEVTGDQRITNAARNNNRIPLNGTVPLNIEAGNRSWANWAPQWMHSPVQSIEVWGTGGTAGLSKIEVFIRPAGSGSGPGQLVTTIATAVDAPAPQGRYLINLDTRAFPNGDYELFVQATTPSGQKSHPSYGDELHQFDFSALSGAYYPIPVRIQN